MRTEQDRVYVTAQSPGWVWLRVPWDPWWFAPDGVPLKGGPGHLVVWADTGHHGIALGRSRQRRPVGREP